MNLFEGFVFLSDPAFFRATAGHSSQNNSEKEKTMSEKYQTLASAIIQNVGGASNVAHLEHCSTRLRFTLVDPAKADREKLKSIKGVMGVIGSGVQCQVVIGNDVIEVYDEIMKAHKFNGGAASSAAADKGSLGSRILDFMVGVFQPLVPAIAGAGILKAFLSLFTMLGWMSADSGLYTVLFQAADAALYFLPVMVAVTMATKLNINRLVAVAAVGALILPNMTAAIGEGLNLLGLNIQNIQYSYQVFPAVLSVAFLYYVEKFVTRWSPKPIRVFFVPMVCFILVVPVTLAVLDPLGFNIGQLLTAGILFLYDKLGWLAVGLLAAVLPFMIAMGMHKALVPYAVSSISEMGQELLYMPASLAHNISEGGACFGVAIRTKNSELRQAAVSAGISAIFGITEPALYGVTLQHRKCLYAVVAGSFVGGVTVGLAGLKAFVAMGPGLAGMAMFMDPANAMNLVWAFVGFGVSLAVSFVGSVILFRDDVILEAEEVLAESTGEPAETFSQAFAPAELSAPVSGDCVALDTVKDEVFASGIMGKGTAFQWDGDTVYAPCSGKVAMVANTGHAIGFVAEGGQEILIHVGLDTVALEGKGFTPLKKAGETVSKGEAVLKVDRDYMKSRNVDLTTPMVITNAAQFQVEPMNVGSCVKAGQDIVLVCA